MNPFYQQLRNMGMASQAQPGPMFANPMQKVSYILQAMQNPAAFVRQHFPDIPSNISNDPNQVFNYLQQTRSPVGDQQIQQANQMAGQIQGNSQFIPGKGTIY